ncbi:PH domain-containing protein [Actinophytocola algeriensis]|uniref:Membrane protein YdbS with pleckstrin-like domain n=1 Tax=Actinophytocola algeriensis TaxID=1768010 RepID=A0A7W7PZ63_9PSEU|nr:PH domain-containing protein [Actinophytocola algeriensis]MBB4903881.1 membrane protein YdbS with pleckstrin-like domain [Actinophytocola algeriensis]MBE1477262.1 membrane protein YdbS with pleckstrin-like domain [Actinophytocola algeriensis]
MAYPEDLLSEGESVILHKHSHWKMLLLPYIVLIAVLGVGVWLTLLVSDTSWSTAGFIAIGAVALILLVWLFFIPFIRWRTTHFVVTTDRVMAKEGVIKTTGITIPMNSINSVRFEHGLVDRIFGCGTLIIESASQEPLEFDDIPAVERVHTLLYREINDNPHDDFRPGGAVATDFNAQQGVAPTQPYPPQGDRRRR